MNKPKTQKLPIYSNDSLLVSKPVPETDELTVEYKLVEVESSAVDEVFNLLFEKLDMP